MEKPLVSQAGEMEEQMSLKEFVAQLLDKSFNLEDLSQLNILIQQTTNCLGNIKQLFFEFTDHCAFYFLITIEAIDNPYLHELNQSLSVFFEHFSQACYYWKILEDPEKFRSWIRLVDSFAAQFETALTKHGEENIIITNTVPEALNTLLVMGLTFAPFNHLSNLFESLFAIITNRLNRNLAVTNNPWGSFLSNMDLTIQIYSYINLSNLFEEADLKKFTLYIVESGLDSKNQFKQHLTRKAINDLASTVNVSSRDLFAFFQKEISDLLIKQICCNAETNPTVLYDCLDFFSMPPFPGELLRWILPALAVKGNKYTRMLLDELQKVSQKPAIYHIKRYLVDILIYIFYQCKGDVQLIYKVFLYLSEYCNEDIFSHLLVVFNPFTEAFFHRISLDRDATLRGLSFIYNVTTSSSKIDPEKPNAICDVELDIFTKNAKTFVSFLQQHFSVYIHRVDPKIMQNTYTIIEKVVLVQSLQQILTHFDSQFINRYRTKIYFTIRLLLSERFYANRNILKAGLNIMMYFIEKVDKVFLQNELTSICLLTLPLVKILPNDATVLFDKLLSLRQYSSSFYYQLYFIPEMPLLKSVNELISQKLKESASNTSMEVAVPLLDQNQTFDSLKSDNFALKYREIYSLLPDLSSDNEKLREVILRRLYSLLDSSKEKFYNLYSVKSDEALNEKFSQVGVKIRFDDGDQEMSFSEIFREIIIHLLQSVKFFTSAEIRNQTTNCLGVLGAIDPRFLNFDLPFSIESFEAVDSINSIDYCDRKIFLPNKKPFKLIILQILMNMVKSSTKVLDYNCASYAIQELLKQFTSRNNCFLIEDCISSGTSGSANSYQSTQRMDEAIEKYVIDHQTQQISSDSEAEQKRLSRFDQIKQVLLNERKEVLDLNTDLTGELLVFSQVLERTGKSRYNLKEQIIDQFEENGIEHFFKSIKPSMTYYDFLKRFLHMLYHCFIVYHTKTSANDEDYSQIFSQQFSNPESQRCSSQYLQEWNRILPKLKSLQTPKQIFVVCYHSIFRSLKLAYFLTPCLLLMSLGLGSDTMRDQFAKQFKSMIDRFVQEKSSFNPELIHMASELICHIYDYLKQWHQNRKLVHNLIIHTIFIRNRVSRFDKEFSAVSLILDSLDNLVMARLAYYSQSYHKALHYLELHYNESHQSSVSSVGLNSFIQENVQFYSQIYYGLSDRDSLKGLQLFDERQLPSVDQLFHQHLMNGESEKQLLCGAKLISKYRKDEKNHLDSYDYQEKYFNSLLQMDQSISHFIPGFKQLDNSDSMSFWTPNTTHYLIESAWRLSSWSQIDDLSCCPNFGENPADSATFSPTIGTILSSMYNREAPFVLENKIMDIRNSYLSSLNAALLSNVSTSYARTYDSSILYVHIMHDIQQFASTVYNRLLDDAEQDEPTSSSQMNAIFTQLISHWRVRNRILPIGEARLQVNSVQRALIHLLNTMQKKKFDDNCLYKELFHYWHDSMHHSLECGNSSKAYIALLEAIQLEHSLGASRFLETFSEKQQIDFRVSSAEVLWIEGNRPASLKVLRMELDRKFREIKQICYIEILKNLSSISENELLDISNSLALNLSKTQYAQLSGGKLAGCLINANSSRIASLASNQSPVKSSSLLEISNEEHLRNFGKLQLKYALYCDQAKMFNSNTLIILYKSITIACPKWESGHFHLAMFFRRLLKEYQRASLNLSSKTTYNISKPDEILDLKSRVIKSLCESLKFGSFKYVSISLPTLINTWLELGNEYLSFERKIQQTDSSRSVTVMKDLLRRFTDRSTSNIHQLITVTNNATFFVVLDILVGHMMHQYEPIAKTIKQILIKLIADFPHQMAWQFSRSLNADGRRGVISKDFVYQAAKTSTSHTYLNRYFENFRFFSNCIKELARYKPPKSMFNSRSTCQDDAKFVLSLSKVCPNLIRSLSTTPKFVFPSNQIFSPNALNLQRVSSKDPFDQCFKAHFIEKLDDSAQIMKSLQIPKKITFVCADGKKKIVLCKCLDDLRKDRCMLNFCDLFNQCYRGQVPTVEPMSHFDDQFDSSREIKVWAQRKQNPLSVRTYYVSPLSDSFGVIEWISNLKSMKSLIEGQYTMSKAGKKKYNNSKTMFVKSVFPTSLTKEKRVERFLSCIGSFQPPVFQNWFHTYYADSYSWYVARKNYTRTAAVYSILGYILGLGDRHGENIQMDPTTGQVVHVDFNCLFNRGEEFHVPECVPFRLTHNMIAAMGTLGYEGMFRATAEDVLLTVRQFREQFSNHVTIFLYDILAEWMESTNRVEIVEKSVFNVEARLYGLNSRSSRKLHTGKAMSIAGQVNSVIKEATDINNLGAMYHGWASFI